MTLTACISETSGTSAPVQSWHQGAPHLNTLTEIRNTRRRALKYLFAFACAFPLLPYPTGYSEVGAVARKEWQENARPKLATAVPPDFAHYKVIFLGYPVWNHAMPMPVYTFLESSNLAGKLIAPFSTHMGDGLADGPEQIARLCPGAKVVPGLAISGTAVGHCQDEIKKWLRSNNLL